MTREKSTSFEISKRKIVLRILDMVLVLFSLVVVGILFRFEYFSVNSGFLGWALILAIYLNVFASVFELYDLQKTTKFYTIFKNVVCAASATVLFFLFTPYLTPEIPDDGRQVVCFYLVILLILLAWRFAYITLLSSPRFYKRVLIIGDSSHVEDNALQLQKCDPTYNIIGFMFSNLQKGAGWELSSSSTLLQFYVEDLTAILRDQFIDEIVLSNSRSNGQTVPVYEELLKLIKTGFPVKDYNEVYEEKSYKVPVHHIEKDCYKIFPFSRNHENKFYLFFQRTTDILISFFGIIIGALLVPFIFVGDFFGNRGSLLYRQKRVGKNGKIFQILKFRTMKINAEPNGAQWAQRNDSRVTRFGKFLRRSRLDEFPQFYNILKGEMSLIGPRPERPVFVKELSEMIYFYDIRHVIKPGLTGWAQVMTDYGNSHAGSMEKLQYDLYYIKHRNMFMDITVLTKTLTTMMFYRGQ